MKTQKMISVGAVSRFVTLFILLASLLVLPKAHAAVGDSFTIDGLNYTVLSLSSVSRTGTVSVEAGSLMLSGNITIPASVTYEKVIYSVVLVPAEAFRNIKGLNTITIPESVTKIGERAFQNCGNLTGIAIPNSLTSIGNEMLSGCISLKSIIIPDSVTKIGQMAFQNCSSLTSIVIPDSVTYIQYSTFRDCSSLASVTMGKGVTFISSAVFRDCSSLTSIVIPDSVTTIGDDVFFNCSSLTSIEIPDSVTSIGGGAFYGCSSLTSIVIPNRVTIINDRMFNGCSSLTSIEIPDSVTSIGGGVFASCSSLTNIVIPNSVTSIGDDVFSNCNSLRNVIIGNRVTSIGGGVFYRCSKLTSIVIPNSVTSIGDHAFWECSSLVDIVVGENNPNYSSLDGVLFNKGQTILIQFPGGKSGAYTVPDSVTSIGDHSFYNSSLISIIISEGVTSIENSAFSYCSSLTNAIIGTKVITIGNNAFCNCLDLTSIIIPNSVNSIGNDAFHSCVRLTNAIIGNSVTSIGDNAFHGCSNLTSITIPDSVTSIGDGAFYYCCSLTNAIIGNRVASIGSSAFYDCFDLTSIIIPESVIEIGDSAFQSCGKLRGVYFEGNAPSVGANAFGDPAIIYYRAGTTGWTNPWGGRPTALWESPEITEQPQSQAVTGGAPVKFIVVAKGTEPLSYHWYKDGVLIEGATEASYTISSVSAEDLGSYTVIVSNNLGEVTSSPAVITFKQVSPVITWATPAAITYGTPLGAAQLNAKADVEGSFEYKPAAGTILDAGTHKLSVNFTPTDAVNYTSASESVEIVVNKATPVITWATPAAITYGTVLGATQLNATANVEGSFAYTPAAGTKLEEGTHTLSVTFTPTDIVNYNTATAEVELVVKEDSPPALSYELKEGTLILTYSGGKLEVSDDLVHWIIVDEDGEFEVTIGAEKKKFYRVAK